MSTKTNREIAADILIAAVTAKALIPSGPTPDSQADTLMRMYGIILEGLDSPPQSRLPKAK